MRFVSWFWRITVAKIRLNERRSQSWFYGVIIVACSVMLFIVFLLSFYLSVFYYAILHFFHFSSSLLSFHYLFFIAFSFCLSLCYSLFLPSILMLFFVFFPSITFSYVIPCFKHSITFSFCLSLCYSLFYYCDLCSKQQPTDGRKQFQKARAEVDLNFLG